jgi:hypothetical protein
MSDGMQTAREGAGWGRGDSVGDMVTSETSVGRHSIAGYHVEVIRLTWRNAEGSSSYELCDTKSGQYFTADGCFDEYPSEEQMREAIMNSIPTVQCKLCHELTPERTAHLHQGKWVGDECCWDERLRSTE